MRIKPLSFFVLFLAFLLAFNLQGQDLGGGIKEDQDIKIGLVLSGGGAKGMAHIGTLKVLDSLGLQVDYIAGTSMGAIVGSLYASGYTGKQLDSIFNSVDYDDMIADHIPRASKTFYERENSEKYALTLPFDKFKVSLPSALSRGQNTFNMLSRLMLHVCDINDFEDLPIPFFCIATNIESGKPVVMEKGSLPQAVMASGSLPSVFQPMILNDKILIDGGVVNNYPVDELRDRGMNVIIGVDVQDTLATRKELISATDILQQISNYRTINHMKDKALKTDVYIKPSIKEYGVLSFSQGRQIIDKGEEAALGKIEELKTVLAMKTYEPRVKPQIKPTDSLIINGVSIYGMDRYTRAYIMGKLKLKSNKKISYDDFRKGVNNLVATNNFDSFIYEFKPSKGMEGYDLITHLKESSVETFLRLGVHYDDLYKSAALINLTKKHLLFDNDVASLDIVLGDNIRYNFEYFIDKGFYWSLGARSRFNQFHRNVPVEALVPEDNGALGLNKIDVELKDFTNQFYVQTLFRRDFALSMGAEHKYLNIESETLTNLDGEQRRTFENSVYLSLFGTLKLDTYNNKYFPSKGFYFDGDFHLYVYSSDYNNNFSEFSIAKADIGYSHSLTNRLSINLTTQGGFKVGENPNPYLDFVLGGYGNNFINNFISFYGYDFLTITGDSFVKGIITADFEFYKNNHVNLSANYANVANDIFKDGEWFTSPDFSGYAIGYGLETFLGPIEVKYSWSPEIKDSILFFNLGFWF